MDFFLLPLNWHLQHLKSDNEHIFHAIEERNVATTKKATHQQFNRKRVMKQN
jgi:hypothetical protein